jgi:hypothetical protein
MHLMTSTRCEISAKQLERELGVTYKTAWRTANLIRNELMVQDDEPLSGHVEADETYVGGKPRAADMRPPSPCLPGAATGPAGVDAAQVHHVRRRPARRPSARHRRAR